MPACMAMPYVLYVSKTQGVRAKKYLDFFSISREKPTFAQISAEKCCFYTQIGSK